MTRRRWVRISAGVVAPVVLAGVGLAPVHATPGRHHRYAVSARLSSANIVPHGQFVFAGTVRPRAAGKYVRLQRYTRGHWSTLASARLTASSTYRFYRREATVGSYTFRVLKPASRAHPAGASRTLHAHVVTRLSSVRKRATTVVGRSATVRSVAGDPATLQQTVLAPGATLPVVGHPFVLPSSANAPSGLLGTVTSVESNGDGSHVVTTKPASLSDAYSSFDVGVHATLSHAAIVDPQASPVFTLADRRVKGGPAASGAPLQDLSRALFVCPTHDVSDPQVDITADLSKVSVDASISAYGPALNFDVFAPLTFKLDIGISGSLSCHLDQNKVIKAVIPIPGAPGLVVTLQPFVQLSADGKVGVVFTWSPSIVLGYNAYGHQVSTVHSFASHGSVKTYDHASFDAYTGLSAELSLAGRAGITGNLGPNLTGSLDGTCLRVDGSLKAALTADLDIFVKHWSVDLGNHVFDKKRIYSNCDPGPLDVATTSVPAATVGQFYDATLSADGGSAPYAWSQTGGSLPPGVTLDDSGELSGTPASTGTYPFTATVTDQVGASVSRDLVLTVGDATTSPDAISDYSVSSDLGCDLTADGDFHGEFYGDTACGTVAAVGGSLFGPSSIPFGDNLTGDAAYSAWTPVDQQTTGAGTPGDPFVTTTTVSADGTDLGASQTDTYAPGTSAVTTSTTYTNAGSAPLAVTVYKGFDCYPGDSDTGTGQAEPASGAVSCISDNTTADGARTLRLSPTSPDSTFVEEYYGDMWAALAAGGPLPDTVDPSDHDTAVALSWTLVVPAHGSRTVTSTTQLLVTTG